MTLYEKPKNFTPNIALPRLAKEREREELVEGGMAMRIPPRRTYSYGHLPGISGYKWDYTFYKWGFVSTYN